jgi:hypothetical protein
MSLRILVTYGDLVRKDEARRGSRKGEPTEVEAVTRKSNLRFLRCERTGISLNIVHVQACERCVQWVAGCCWMGLQLHREVTNLNLEEQQASGNVADQER